MPDAKPGIYKIPILLEYKFKDTDEVLQKFDIVSITVDTETKITAYVSEPNFIVGNTATVGIELVNKGLSDAQFLTINLGESNFYDVMSQQEIYVGELDSDDHDTIDFDLRLKYPIPNELPITVHLDYYDALNNHHQDIQTVKIAAYTNQEAKEMGLIQPNNTWVYLVIAIVLIVAFIVYRKIKKRRKRKR
jgi:hypothetical protein